MAREINPAFVNGSEWRGSDLSTLYRRAQYEAQHPGDRENGLYWVKNAKLMEIFEITADEERQLQTIISPDEKRRRNREHNVKEPGRTGALWRIHYSVRLPSLTCDFFKLTTTEGRGTGESLAQFPMEDNDYVLADCGYSTALGIQHVVSSGAQVTVRVNTGSLPLQTSGGPSFDLLAALTSLKRAGTIQSWPVVVVGEGVAVPGRVCAIRKTQEAIKIAHARLRKEAARKGKRVQARTLVFAKYVIVFTTWRNGLHSRGSS